MELKSNGLFWSGRRGSCLVRSRLTAIPCFVFRAYSPYYKSTPASARSRNSLESKSRHYHQANKKHPSFDECSLLAGDEARTRDILLGKEAFYHWITPAGCISIIHAHILKSTPNFNLLVSFKPVGYFKWILRTFSRAEFHIKNSVAYLFSSAWTLSFKLNM